MTGIFAILIPLALAAVTLTLFVGVFAMFRGGAFNRAWSNRLMRMRVALQFAAILIIVAAVALGGHGRG
jgi:uncharacterized membrane protein